MRILDFRFNGCTIEPVIEFGIGEPAAAITILNIKNLGVAHSLRESLDIAIRAMEEKEKADSWEAIIALEDTIDKRTADLDADRAKLAEMRKAHSERYFSMTE